MKKIITLTLCVILALVLWATSVSATSFTYDSFVAGDGYGSIEKVSNNIMKMKGEPEYVGGMKYGPYSKASTSKLADGINEETYVEINFDEMKYGEYFDVSLALKNGNGDYVTESAIRTQAIGENTAKLTANGVPEFEAIIDKNGIYTYRWNMYMEGNKTYVTFTVLNGNTVVGTTGKVDFDTIATSDTKNPIAEQKDVSVKYLWFCNICVENGINVYTSLPDNKVDFEQPKDEVISVKDAEKTGEILRDSLKNSDIVINPIDTVEIGVKVDELKEFDDAKMKDALAEKAKDAKLVNFYDITLPVKVNGEETGNLSELTNTISLTLQLPENLPAVTEGYNRTYYIVREHNGEVSILDAVVNEDNTISFETDKFSTYALAYEDVKAEDPTDTDEPDKKPVEKPEEKPGEKDETPKTGIETGIGIFVVVATVATLGLIVLNKRNK